MRSSERAVQRVQHSPGGGVGRRVPIGHAPPELSRPGVTEHGQEPRSPIRWQRVEPTRSKLPMAPRPLSASSTARPTASVSPAVARLADALAAPG